MLLSFLIFFPFNSVFFLSFHFYRYLSPANTVCLTSSVSFSLSSLFLSLCLSVSRPPPPLLSLSLSPSLSLDLALCTPLCLLFFFYVQLIFGGPNLNPPSPHSSCFFPFSFLSNIKNDFPVLPLLDEAKFVKKQT